MKLLLCSDFSGVAFRWLNKIVDLKQKNKCLFVGYANEEKDFSPASCSATEKLIEFGFEIVELNENYKFDENIDLIFVRGGNTTQLIHYLREFNQFEKLKNMIKNGTPFVGVSAGAILAGTDSEWTLKSEPYEFDLKQLYGKDALKGFGFVDKLIFVHASRYRMARSYEMKDKNDIFRTLDTDCYFAYLSDVRHFKKSEFVKIGNNQALLFDDGKQKLLTFDWKNIKVKK